MKANIHPNWYSEAKVVCACGAIFTTGSTMEQIRVEICSKCHPLFTGTQKLVDTLGQVDRFEQKKVKSQKQAEERKKILEFRASKKVTEKTDKPSLKDLLMQARKNLPKAS
jgi:large subunit ribosomal protein L31